MGNIKGIGKGKIEFFDNRTIKWDGKTVDGYWIVEFIEEKKIRIWITYMEVRYWIIVDDGKFIYDPAIINIVWYKDSDPCQKSNGGCKGTCDSKKPGPLGSYSCSCAKGFKLSSDNKSCDRSFIHPCDKADKGGCDDVCTKVGNSAKCSCTKTGYTLKADGKGCEMKKCSAGEYRAS